MVKKITMMQQRSTEQRSTVDLRVHLTNFKTLVSQSMSAVFRLSQGSVATTYCRWGGNLCDVHIENILTNQVVKEFWKSVHICQSYHQTAMLSFFESQCSNVKVLNIPLQEGRQHRLESSPQAGRWCGGFLAGREPAPSYAAAAAGDDDAPEHSAPVHCIAPPPSPSLW